MKAPKEDYTKIGFNISNELLAKVDSYANSLHINRSSALCVLLSQALDYKQAFDMVGTLPNLFEKLENLKSSNVDKTN